MFPSRGSGHPLADRRFDYAMAYRAAGEVGAAIELVEQALALAPGWAAGWLVLGEMHEEAGEPAAAIACYARANDLDPQDVAGAGVRLARLGAGSDQDALTTAHVAALFDDYAGRFETSLADLGYRAPALLLEVVTGLGRSRFTRALDLGCGTGLAGEAFAPLCARLDGVDLSERMLAESRRKGLYASLRQAEIVAALAEEPGGSAELILAADVLVYLGDLLPLFRQAARILSSKGLFAATVQHRTSGPGYALGADLRYAHSTAAIESWTADAGLAVRQITEAWTRRDAGQPLPGLVFVLERC